MYKQRHHEEFLSKTYEQLMHLDIKETTQSNRGTRFTWTFLHRKAQEKMPNTCKYQRTANQKDNVASPHTRQKGQHTKSTTINAGEEQR